MPIAAGVRHEVLGATVSTLVLMAAERRGATGGDSAQHFPVMLRQTMVLGEARQSGADDFAQGQGLRLTGARRSGHERAWSGLGALSGAAKVDQVEGAADVVQAFLAHMEVGGRGREPAVAQ